MRKKCMSYNLEYRRKSNAMRKIIRKSRKSWIVWKTIWKSTREPFWTFNTKMQNFKKISTFQHQLLRSYNFKYQSWSTINNLPRQNWNNPKVKGISTITNWMKKIWQKDNLNKNSMSWWRNSTGFPKKRGWEKMKIWPYWVKFKTLSTESKMEMEVSLSGGCRFLRISKWKMNSFEKGKRPISLLWRILSIQSSKDLNLKKGYKSLPSKNLKRSRRNQGDHHLLLLKN